MPHAYDETSRGLPHRSCCLSTGGSYRLKGSARLVAEAEQEVRDESEEAAQAALFEASARLNTIVWLLSTDALV